LFDYEIQKGFIPPAGNTNGEQVPRIPNLLSVRTCTALWATSNSDTSLQQRMSHPQLLVTPAP